MTVQRPSGFVEPCLPSKAERPPSGPLWVHEIKHDGYRLMVRRDGSRVRCFTRNGNDWTDRFPAIVQAASHLKATSFLIDGEVVIISDDGTPDFHALRSQHRDHEAVLVAFDLIERDGEDLRDLPLNERKRRLGRLIGKTKISRAIQYGQHLKGNGASVLAYVCRLGLEGIVSKRVDAPYRSGPSKTWLKSKNPAMDRARLCLPLRLAASQKELGYVHMVFDDDIDGGGHESYRASPSVDGTRQEHSGRDIPYGDRKN